MFLLLSAALLGIVAGMRAMMAPAFASWAVASQWISAQRGWPAFMAWRYTPWVFTLLAAGELVTDQLPSTPSRKVPVQFGTRIISGGLSGATIGSTGGQWIGGLVAGVLGAVVGTLGGAAARGSLARALDNDHPAAVIEDVLALALGVLAVLMAA
jgi:uncharacterized membrane protein